MCGVYALKIYHRINRKSGVWYPGPGFLCCMAFDAKKVLLWINQSIKTKSPLAEKLTSILFFKRLGSPDFHYLFNQYIFFFSKHYEYYKTGALEICVNFSSFFERCSLNDFHEYIMSMGLMMGKDPLLKFDVFMTNKRPTRIYQSIICNPFHYGGCHVCIHSNPDSRLS